MPCTAWSLTSPRKSGESPPSLWQCGSRETSLRDFLVFALGSLLLLGLGRKHLALGLIPSAVVCIVGLLMHCETTHCVASGPTKVTDAALTGTLIFGGRTDLFKHPELWRLYIFRNNL